MNKRIYLNQDDSSFLREHPLEDMTVEGIQKVVDFYAKGKQLGGLAFCVNMQRALFESQAWETLIDDYDPSLGDEQPALSSREALGMLRLKQNGVDQFKVWLERARYHGIEACLTMRMNDCHGLEGQTDSFWTGHRVRAEDQAHFRNHCARFWRENPQLRRAPYRYERSFESALDYGHRKVRERQLSLIAELFERYDMDGFEMDWMRWIFMFAPGGEERGLTILTDFIAKVGQLRDAAETRWGHPILLRHRVPADPQTCLSLGFDVPTWAKKGLADHIVLSSFGWAANFDYPIALWRHLVGGEVKILALVEPSVMISPGVSALDYQFVYGTSSSALQSGADGVYLFNECYRESSGQDSEKALLLDMLNHIGSLHTLERCASRHAVSYPVLRAPGEPARHVLPISLACTPQERDSGRWAENITLRLSLGCYEPTSSTVLCLGFSFDATKESMRDVVVRINTMPVERCDEPDLAEYMSEVFPDSLYQRYPEGVAWVLYYRVSSDAVQDGVNVIELEPPHDAPGALNWAEFIVMPMLGRGVGLTAKYLEKRPDGVASERKRESLRLSVSN